MRNFAAPVVFLGILLSLPFYVFAQPAAEDFLRLGKTSGSMRQALEEYVDFPLHPDLLHRTLNLAAARRLPVLDREGEEIGTLDDVLVSRRGQVYALIDLKAIISPFTSKLISQSFFTNINREGYETPLRLLKLSLDRQSIENMPDWTDKAAR